MKQRKRKRFWVIKPINFALMMLSVILCVPLYFYNIVLFAVAVALTVPIVVYSAYRMFRIQDDLHKMITETGRALTDTQEGSLLHFPLPGIIISDINEIVWYNNAFFQKMLNSEKNIVGFDADCIIKDGAESVLKNQGRLAEYNNGFYRQYCVKIIEHGRPYFIIYFSDVTELNQIRLTYEKKKPVIIMINIDNYDESIGNESEGNERRTLSAVRDTIQAFADSTTGVIRRIGQDKYMLVVEHQDMIKIIEKDFDLLYKVKEITNVKGIPITVSIGAANVTDTFIQAEYDARQALDMALGRGGDQAAVKTDKGYEFFGGYSKGTEKRTKVKTRMVASALRDLIKGADNVLIMGHKYSDLDAIGSAVGIAQAASFFNQNVYVVVDTSKTLAENLVEKIRSNMPYLFIHPDDAADYITEKTLVVITDTHTSSLVESEKVYRAAKQVVVIDHHRKVINHIDDAVIFYHEPYASSASEMVTELIQYMGDEVKTEPCVADALLSGITLDTKNFILKTGVRTFEAAAYLRRAGADTVEVRKLFASTMDAYQQRSRIISGAEIYKGCAVSVCDFTSGDLRIVAPQAADELLTISGVNASFVLFEEGDVININARSLGDMNVQITMEKLGGGGHFTMAGAQIKGTTCDRVRQQLLEIIDEQLDKEQQITKI